MPQFRNGTISFGGLGGITVRGGREGGGPDGADGVLLARHRIVRGRVRGLGSGGCSRGVMAEGGVLISFQGTTGGDLLVGHCDLRRGRLRSHRSAAGVRREEPQRRSAAHLRDRLQRGRPVLGCDGGDALELHRGGGAELGRLDGSRIASQNDWTPALMTIHGAPGVDVVDHRLLEQQQDRRRRVQGARRLRHQLQSRRLSTAAAAASRPTSGSSSRRTRTAPSLRRGRARCRPASTATARSSNS